MLTEKELKVLELRKKGAKQSEIASKLSISQPAVSSFTSNIDRKIAGSLELIELLKGMGIDLSIYKRKK